MFNNFHWFVYFQIPVHSGASRPLVGQCVSFTAYHGNDGFGDVPDPEAPGIELAQSEHAVQTMIRLVNEFPGETHSKNIRWVI